jgi:hypothetical protein
MRPPDYNLRNVENLLALLPDLIESLASMDVSAIARTPVPEDPDTGRARASIGPMTDLAAKARSFKTAADQSNVEQGLVSIAEMFDKGYNLFKAQQRFTSAQNEMRGITGGGVNARVFQSREAYRALGGDVSFRDFTPDDALQDAADNYRKALDERNLQEKRRAGVSHIQGPFQNLQQAKIDLDNAMKYGHSDIVKDATLNLQMAQERVDLIDKKRGTGFGGSSFMARNIGLMMGYSAGLIGGPGGGAGRAAIGLMAPFLLSEGNLNPVNIALAALAASAIHAASALSDYAKTSYLMGSEARSTAVLSSLGISTDKQPEAAARLREALGNDPFAVMASRAIGGGGFVAPRPFGPVDEGVILEDHIKLLRTYGEEHGKLEMLRQARMLHLDGYTAELLASKDIYNAKLDDARASARLADPGNQQAGTDLAANWGRLTHNFGLFMTEIGKILMPIGNFFAAGFAEDFKILAELPANFSEIGARINDLVHGRDVKEGIRKRTEAEAKHINAMDNHANALNAQTFMMKDGTAGGGHRVTEAIGSAMRGELFRQAAAAGALTYGAFGIS